MGQSPINHPTEHKWFWQQLWNEDLRSFFMSFLSDFVKTLSILAALYLFWEVVAWLRFRGYPDDLCQKLEKTHFAFMWIALLSTGVNFVLRQVVVIWNNKR
jgi:hypothetical protein